MSKDKIEKSDAIDDDIDEDYENDFNSFNSSEKHSDKILNEPLGHNSGSKVVKQFAVSPETDDTKTKPLHKRTESSDFKAEIIEKNKTSNIKPKNDTKTEKKPLDFFDNRAKGLASTNATKKVEPAKKDSTDDYGDDFDFDHESEDGKSKPTFHNLSFIILF